MAITTIPWSDGSGDNIYLTYPEASGDQTVQVSSDANTGAARSKVVTFSSNIGGIERQLTIEQAGAPQQYTLEVHPSSYSGSTPTNPSNAYTSESSTSYAQLSVTKTAGSSTSVYFRFDTSSIPANAVIDSVECNAKAAITYTTNLSRTIQMFSGTTAVGESQTLTSTAKVFEFAGDTWTDVSDVRIRVRATRNSGSSTAYIRFYGATLTIKYTV